MRDHVHVCRNSYLVPSMSRALSSFTHSSLKIAKSPAAVATTLKVSSWLHTTEPVERGVPPEPSPAPSPAPPVESEPPALVGGVPPPAVRSLLEGPGSAWQATAKSSPKAGTTAAQEAGKRKYMKATISDIAPSAQAMMRDSPPSASGHVRHHPLDRLLGGTAGRIAEQPVASAHGQRRLPLRYL